MVVNCGTMKTAILFSIGLCHFANALEVHEWGTFTVLSGPSGDQIPWYASYHDLARLPPFVSSGLGFKAGMATIRMETPVLYFYPEKEMAVTVDVSFVNGSIAETFPHSSGGSVAFGPPYQTPLFAAKWTGTLHPPTDKKALAEIPAILASPNAEPYGAAREVPDAWIFESDLKPTPGSPVQHHFPQVEKFIFYRGVGNDTIPVTARVQGDNVTVENNWIEALQFGVALRVRDGKAAWVRVPVTAGRPVKNTPAENMAEITFPPLDRPVAEVENELAAEWKKVLAQSGLTPAEASAMVETWRSTWFRESGERVFLLMPQAPVDAMLPLEISPTPEKTTRVFVARIEMISDQTGARLIDILSDTNTIDDKKFADFTALDLGRFGAGATDIAVAIQRRRMTDKFHSLIKFGAKAEN